MLKELNRIAAGLLGLHGYPTQPLTVPAQAVPNSRDGVPSGGIKARPTRKVAAPARRSGTATHACG